jgi:hypothetical protein
VPGLGSVVWSILLAWSMFLFAHLASSRLLTASELLKLSLDVVTSAYKSWHSGGLDRRMTSVRAAWATWQIQSPPGLPCIHSSQNDRLEKS